MFAVIRKKRFSNGEGNTKNGDDKHEQSNGIVVRAAEYKFGFKKKKKKNGLMIL